MLTVQYASQNSTGNLSTSIGWLNFGPGFSLNPSQNPLLISNRIPGGYELQFKISSTATITPSTYTIPAIDSMTSPVAIQAPFGVINYQGIGGNVSLQLASIPDNSAILTYTINITDISVTDRTGCPVTNYTFYLADSNITNISGTGNAQTWQIVTNGGNFEVTQQIPSYNNTFTGPIVSGVGSQTVMETGDNTAANDTSTYVYSTTSPTTISTVFTTNGGNPSITFGIIVPPAPKPLLISGCRCCCINYLSTSNTQTFSMPQSQLIRSIEYDDQYYEIGCDTVTVTGALATYQISASLIIVTLTETNAISLALDHDVFRVLYTDACDYNIVPMFGKIIFGYCEET